MSIDLGKSLHFICHIKNFYYLNVYIHNIAVLKKVLFMRIRIGIIENFFNRF